MLQLVLFTVLEGVLGLFEEVELGLDKVLFNEKISDFFENLLIFGSD